MSVRGMLIGQLQALRIRFLVKRETSSPRLARTGEKASHASHQSGLKPP